jgi:hypothetical protein
MKEVGTSYNPNWRSVRILQIAIDQKVKRSKGQKVKRSKGQKVKRSKGQKVKRSKGQKVKRSKGQTGQAFDAARIPFIIFSLVEKIKGGGCGEIDRLWLSRSKRLPLR